MCGIAGYLNFNGELASAVTLEKMAKAIAHRGPDGEGVYVDRQCGLSHRRLSIIDLSAAGKQPMVSADERFVLSYNGEIYNFQELRDTLEKKGHYFRSLTDTEVVLNALVEWGPSALENFNGMFALALWDRREQSLLLGRDRYGIKPLYYLQSNNEIIFGSEIKAILQHPSAQSVLNRKGLLEYLTFQNFFGEQTLFSNIKMFSAGCWLKTYVDATQEHEKYWDFNFEEPKNYLDGREYEEELNRLFVQAVSRQLVSDVPVGSYLSGGIDSGSIAAVASGKIDNLRTYTVGFDLNSASGIEIGFDERNAAEQLSYHFKSEQYEMVLKSGDMERCMKKLVWHMEEPRVGQCYPNYYAAQLASKFGKVVLSGVGGDELFAGYPWRYASASESSGFDDYITKYFALWQRLGPNPLLSKLLGPIWADVKNINTRDTFQNVYAGLERKKTGEENYVNLSLHFEAKTFLHGLLAVEDKLSMAHSLESRVPFLDNDLVNFAMALPVNLKLGKQENFKNSRNNEQGIFQKTRNGKLIFREVARKHVPSQTAYEVKKGFSAPDESWYRGESLDYVVETLLSSNTKVHSFLDKKIIAQIVNEHLEAKKNNRLMLWSLLCLETWCGHFI